MASSSGPSVTLLSLAAGFALRIFFLSSFQLGAPTFIGVFEGIALHRCLLVSEPLVDTLALCALRLAFDLLFSRLHFTTLLASLAVSFVLSDAATRTRPEHIRWARKRSSRSLRQLRRTIVQSKYWQERFPSPREEKEPAEDSEPSPPSSPAPSRRPAPARIRKTAPAIAAAPSNADDLLTPSSLATSAALPQQRSPLSYVARRDLADDSDNDSLQTPLDIHLVGLPPATNAPIPLVREPSDDPSVPTALPEPDVLSPTTEFSVLTGVEAKAIFAKAETMRQEARAAEEEKLRLELQLEKAITEKRTRDAFLLRREIESVEDRIQKLHAGAARRYFRSGNLSADTTSDAPVDVHGLFVPEAIKTVEKALHDALLAGRNELKVIVGKGKHSKSGRAKLRPAIVEEFEKQGITCQMQNNNSGMLILTIPS
uniref:Smr domain-containing protein n=1 Tax=Mycena chlorophos TaxID=658473 RepID=A0ABQ0M2R9_MYCCL|nr:predicted protein [Mycena chlorophos]